MATLNDLYTYYCQRLHCKPNSGFCRFLDEEYERHGCKRILYSVDVSNNYCGKVGIKPVLDLVKNIKSIIFLNVSNNRLEHEQLEHLVYCLVLHPSIERVSLANNCLHDGSVNHIIKLLEANCCITELDVSGNRFLPASLALIKEKLQTNKQLREKLQREQEAIEEHRAQRVRKAFQAQVTGQLTEENSGGYIHFSTWWKNPQYSLQISKSARVSIVMDITDEMEARLGGFVVMRYDGIRRVVEITTRTIVTESPVSAKRCVVETFLDQKGHYVVMPFTFNQGRHMSYTLSAKLIHDKPTLDEGWVTLDLLDEQYDWFAQCVNSRWSNKGGCASEKTWRYNEMHRIRYTGKPRLYFESAPATLYALLWKEIDPDVNDEREIGFDIVKHDTYCRGKPPLICTADTVLFRKPHERKVAVLLKFTVQSSNLDLFIVPSTKASHQPGNYTLVVFSTVPFEMTASCFPHTWHYRSVLGDWAEDTCGGSRELSQSWKRNPSIALSLEKKETAPPMTVCLELGELRLKDAPGAEVQQLLNTADLSLGELEQEAVIKQFWEKHADRVLEGCIAAVDGSRPHFTTRRTTPFSSEEATMTLLDTSTPFYLVPMAKHAGQMGGFRVHIFCEDPFVVDDVEPLATREREAQLAQYSKENEARRSVQNSTMRSSGVGAHRSAIVRSEILRKCLAAGLKFSDRDFPRGASSMWLDPEAKPPFTFPKEYSWKRLSDTVEGIRCVPSGSAPPFPYSTREWFASVINATAAKPHCISRVFLHYDQQAGFAQFRFFKCNEWVEVTVDDFVPVDAAGNFCYGHSVEPEDVFFALAEKAYAKLHRCYEALERKVAPELTLVDTLRQGLEDVTGGFCSVYPLRCTAGAVLEDEERNALWRKLKETTKSSSFHALILRSDSAGAQDRQHAGILADHLYGVMDARFIESQRLVKLRNWRDGADAVWRGKWAPRSPLWTETLLSVLEYDHTQDAIWLAFDEVLYYFSEMLVTEQHSSFSSAAGHFPADRIYADDTDIRLRSPQFAVTISDVVDGTPSVEVVIGLHQEDARMTITRDRHATARYKSAIGFAVFSTSDNQRHVKKAETRQVVQFVSPFRAREKFVKLSLNVADLDRQKLTVMPFQEHMEDTDTRYIVTVASSDALVTVLPVNPNETAKVTGTWVGVSAGGPPCGSTWRDNPQFFLFPSETMEVSVIVICENLEAAGSIGLTVHNTRLCSSCLHFDPATVVLNVAPQKLASVGGTVTLSGMKERRGMPYVVVPYCTKSGAVAMDFTLKVIANRTLSLTPIEPRLDWHRHHQRISLRAEDGNVGGSPRYPSWRYNPQLVLDLPVEREGRILVSVSNCNLSDTRNALGMMLLKGDDKWEAGRRRKLTYGEDDVVALSEEVVGRVELEVDLDLVGSTQPLILVPYTAIPYREVEMNLSIYAAPEIQVDPVREWKYSCLQEGAFELGQTTGGSRSAHASWINNPFLGLSVIRPTNVVVLLIQYPRGSQAPVVKRCGTRKAFLPPPLSHPDRCTAIELEVAKHDRDLTTISRAGPSKQAELVITTRLEPGEACPYVVIPATSLMEQNIDYKVFVYADHPIDFFPMEKDRLTYV